MSYSQSWLDSPSAIRMVLVIAKVFDVLANQEIDLYLSNSGYTTTDGVTFNPVLVRDISLTEEFRAEDSISMSWGDLEVTNKNGQFDTYLNSSKYVWANRSIKIYYGDPGWTYSLSQIDSTFLKIFDGVIADCDSRNISSFNIKLRDKLERLNSPISEAVLGEYGTWPGSQTNKEQIKPIIFGEVFNVTPVLIDPSQLEYMFSCSNPAKLGPLELNNVSGNGAAELVIEIRDNGAPIYVYSDTVNYGGATINLTNSTFKLSSPAAGDITLSAQGVKKSVNLTTGSTVTPNTYSNTVANIIATIVTNFGKPTTRFTASDLDLANLQAFDAANQIPVGVFLDSVTNVLEVCQSLAKSVSANIIMSRVGKLQLLKFGEPYGTSTTITPEDMLFDTFQISNRLVPDTVKTVKWGKNWTVQSNLTTAILTEHKESFSKEWLEATQKDDTLSDLYKSETQVNGKETLLITSASAQAEALRLLNYYKVQRTVYSFTGRSRLLSLKLGQPVSLNHSRFGLQSGVTGQVVSLVPNWTTGYIEVEVIV